MTPSIATHLDLLLLLQIGLPYTVFQPLYIYGAHTAKDCEQWFVDRIVR